MKFDLVINFNSLSNNFYHSLIKDIEYSTCC